MAIETDQYEIEVRGGKRFEFGKNWSRFLAVLNDDRIALAEQSLRSMLKIERLDGKTFLDIGSGSGLFSLAARSLGARVHSFDYDPQSVACTSELKRRYRAGDNAWIIERGSVLDETYLARLGTFDIVYSWGVLHHTGRMWQAMDNMKPLVKIGGLLFIAIYNDLGPITDRWEKIKRAYNALPRPLRFTMMVAILARQQGRQFIQAARTGRTGAWLAEWTEYEKTSARGMSRWRDEVDWFGGYPYERASIEAVADVYAKDGFRLCNLVDRSSGTGCNEFVFRREAPIGTFVDFSIPGGRSFARRFGRRVVGPFEQRARTWTGRIFNPPELPDGAHLLLFRNGGFVRTVEKRDADIVEITKASDDGAIQTDAFHVVGGFLRRPPEQPFKNERGHMWSWPAPDLEALADNASGGNRGSPVFVFEDGVQLPWPHALHDEIARVGHGRFAHWGRWVYFSTLQNSDPNQNRERFRLIVAATQPRESITG